MWFCPVMSDLLGQTEMAVAAPISYHRPGRRNRSPYQKFMSGTGVKNVEGLSFGERPHLDRAASHNRHYQEVTMTIPELVRLILPALFELILRLIKCGDK
jgi:hypothetical protein